MERYYTAFLELLDIGDGPPLTEEGVLDTARTWIWWADEGGNEYRLNVPGVWAATKQVDRLLALADEAAATDDMPVAVLYGYEPDEVVIAPGGETQQISTGLLLADAQPGLDNLVRPIKLVRWETIGSLRKYLRMQVGEEYGPNVFWQAMYRSRRALRTGDPELAHPVPEGLAPWVGYGNWDEDYWLSPAEAAEAAGWLALQPGYQEERHIRTAVLFHAQ